MRLPTLRPKPRPNHSLALLAAGTALALLAGCHTLPGSGTSSGPGATGGPPVNAATRAAQTRGELAAEKQRLSELFRGTPVVFTLASDGSLRAEVPLTFCFDPGRSTVKPALGAVLDRIAAGQAQTLTRVWVAASPDEASAKPTPLAAERAASVRAYLVGKGLAPARVAAPTLNISGLVRILVTVDATAGG